MPETASVQSSISFQNNKPVWDFASITAYPMEIQQAKDLKPVYVYLSPYDSSELKDILKKAVSGYRREKRDVEIVREDRDIYTSLCDSHFIKLGNATGTPEAQRAWLDKYPEFKPTIVEIAFGGLRMDQKSTDENSGDMLDISVELSESVAVYQELYDPITDKVVRVDMIHNHQHPTEAQYREYRSARRSKFINRTTLWTIKESHGTLEKLYDTVIQFISGASVNGQPCTADTKTVWISSVPLWHKLWIVDQIFGELVEKNA